MRRVAVVLVALAALAAGATAVRAPLQRYDRRLWRIFDNGVSSQGGGNVIPDPLVSYSFAPVGGAGMGTACACATITTADGGAVSFSRSSNGWCTKSNTLANIVAGDLVQCSSNQVRVMPGGDGTGALGVLIERAASNIIQYSEQFDNAAWTLEHVVQPVPTVTADVGVAPDGTTTADLISFPATGAAEDSAIRQDTAAGGGIYSPSVYVRSFDGGTRGTLDFATYNGGTWDCTTCAYDAGSVWSRCTVNGATVNTYWLLGNAGFRCGVARPAQDVLVWGGDLEGPQAAGSFQAASSYIGPTTNSTVTRSAELLSFGTQIPTGGFADVSAKVVTGADIATGAAVYSLEYLRSDSKIQGTVLVSDKLRSVWRYQGVNNTLDTSNGFNLSAANVAETARTQTGISSCLNGTCAVDAGQLSLEYGDGGLYLGCQSGGAQIDGVIKEVTLTASTAQRTGWVGDSISSTTYNDPPGFYALDTGRYVDNWAVGGAVASDCMTQWTSQATSYNTVIAWECGVNDIRADANGATLAATVQAFLLSVEATGRHVIYQNISPWKNAALWTSGRQTQTAAYNAAFTTFCAAHPSFTCVDLYSLLGGGGGDPAVLAVAYNNGDDIHLSVAGAQADAVQTASQYP